VKQSGAKVTEDAMHIPNQLPEVTEEPDILVGLLEELPELPGLQELEDGEVEDHQVNPQSSSSQKHS
jgi:hypothetical protein